MSRKKNYYAIALGASAGGLQSLISFFKAIPPDLPAAYVVIMHLARHRLSYLSEILQSHTKIPVIKTQRRTRLLPGNIYVIQENTYLGIRDGWLESYARPESPLNNAIDEFMISLAMDCGEKGMAVIFSGFGTDGVRGALALSGVGGKVLVEEPTGALVDEMPRAVIILDHPDVVGNATDLAAHVSALIRMNHIAS